MAPCRYHLPPLLLLLLPLLVLLAGQQSLATPVPGADNARHYDLVNHYEKDHNNKLLDLLDHYSHHHSSKNDNLLDFLPDIDRQSIYDTFESYVSYPPYGSYSNSYGSSPNGYSSHSNSYGPASDYNSLGGSGSLGSSGSWVGSGSWTDSGSSSSSSGGYSRGSSRHVLRLEPHCDCAPIDLLALLSGGTALCALGLFCILQATSSVSVSTGSNVSVSARQLLAELPLLDSWRANMDSWQLPADSGQLPNQLDWLLRQLPSQLQPVLQKLTAQLRRMLRQLPEQQLADRVTDAACEVAGQLEKERLGRSGQCQCYSGLLGAMTGFAALGGLIVYALQLASSANTNTSIGIGRSLDTDIEGFISSIWQLASAARSGRAFNIDGNEINTFYDRPDKFKQRKTGGGRPVSSSDGGLLGAVTPPDLPCVPFQLCDINRQAAGFGGTHHTMTRLASLPVSWLLSRSGHSELSFGRLCSALQQSRQDLCHRHYPQCGATRRSPFVHAP